jgi:hypothetical protein
VQKGKIEVTAIISLQLPEERSSKNKNPKKTPSSFPIVIKKLIKTIQRPLLFTGRCSTIVVVVRGRPNPKQKPNPNLKITRKLNEEQK